MIVCLRTDRPAAEIALYDGDREVKRLSWQAHRQLAETIHHKLDELMRISRVQREDITGVVAYQGPGSFTGLRIGLSVANAMAYALQVPIVGANGELWISQGITKLKTQPENLILPDYGAPVHITKPRK